MKKIIIIIPIFFFSALLTAQSDIIYPTKSKKDIKRCKIIKVNNLNIVYYVKDFETDSIEAIAIVKDDIFINLKSSGLIPLYKNHDYNYYQDKYKRALISRNIGIVITGLGIGMFALSCAYYQSERKSGMGCPGTVMFATGAIIINSIGIPIWSANAHSVINT